MTIRTDLETRMKTVAGLIAALTTAQSGEYGRYLYEEMDWLKKCLESQTIDDVQAGEVPGDPVEVTSAIAE